MSDAVAAPEGADPGGPRGGTRSQPTAAPLAAVDIGTNSFHLVVAQPTGGQRFEVIDREKSMVRLGSGSGDMKRLEPEAIERGIVALKRFRQIAALGWSRRCRWPTRRTARQATTSLRSWWPPTAATSTSSCTPLRPARGC